MAKSKKSSVSKTQMIKDAMAKHPDLGPKELAERLSAEGMEISPAYVSTIKSSLKRKSKKRSGSKTNGSNNGSRPQQGGSGDLISVPALVKAQELVKQAGDVAKARKALDVIATLS